MYSKDASEKLKSVSASVGDKIRIISKKWMYEGLLMPRIELGDSNIIVIKLDSGYNVGIDASKIDKIALIEKGKKKKEIKPKPVKPTKDQVSILGCGGTIASKIEYKTGAVFPSIEAHELISLFPELRETKLRSRTILSKFSGDMNPSDWQTMAKETAKEIKQGARGIVLLHGTDTMHYTSAALSFMLKTPVPIVLVGAARSSDRGSSDNKMNLLAGIVVAESDMAEIGVCMHATTNDDYCYFHPGTKVRKMHTSTRDTFKTINRNPIAKVWEDGKIRTISEYTKRGENKLEVNTKLNPNVSLLHAHPGMNPKMVREVGKKSDGLIIAGTGLGHVEKSIIPEIESLIKSNIPVVIAPQTIRGRINLNVYEYGRILNETGIIGHLADWTPETALVKLMIALGRVGKSKNMIEKITEFMMTNIAGEITERSEIEKK